MPDLNHLIPSPATRKLLLRALAAIVVVIFTYQFWRVGERIDWEAFLAAMRRDGNWRYLTAVAVLMPLNWLLEAQKWKILLAPFLEWPYLKVLQATLAGVSVSAATPNRVGEIGGRLLLAVRGERAAVIASSLLGSLCQWIAFLVLAWPALVLTVGRMTGWLEGEAGYALLAIGPLIVVVIAIGGRPLALYLLRQFDRYFKRDSGKIRLALSNVNVRLMLAGSTYAGLRFGVYCTQLYLLLWFFGLELPFAEGLMGIAAIYLVQAGIPLPPGVNLLTRTELGLLLWSVDAEGSVAVLAAYTALFAVNVLIPSIPGYWLIVRKTKIG